MRTLLVFVSLLFAGLAPAAADTAPCPGDCNASGSVTLGEVLLGASIHLERTPLERCPAADANGDGVVRIGEVLRCVRSYLVGCPQEPIDSTPTPTLTVTPQATATPTALPATATPTPSPVPPTASPSATPPAPTATATPTPTSAAAATCGNGLLEGGETCNSCPADCEVGACSPIATTATFHVLFSAGTAVTAATVDLNYRSTVVQLPGSRNDASVRARITQLPPGGQSIINDRDYSVRVVKSRTEPLPEGLFFVVEFDRCAGAPAPGLADFACRVDSCADAFSLPVFDCTCEVAFP